VSPLKPSIAFSWAASSPPERACGVLEFKAILGYDYLFGTNSLARLTKVVDGVSALPLIISHVGGLS
jgi:hypothetical protein